MEHTPCWIWYPGDFELRHSLKLHARRQERDYYRLAIWPVYDCWHSVRFFRRAELTAPEGLTVLARGKGNVGVDGKLYPFGKEIPLSAGTHEIVVEVFREDGLPCLYVEKGSLSGTEGWTAQPFASRRSSSQWAAMSLPRRMASRMALRITASLCTPLPSSEKATA